MNRPQSGRKLDDVAPYEPLWHGASMTGSVPVRDSTGTGIRGKQQSAIGAYRERGIRAREVPHKKSLRSRVIVVGKHKS